MLGIMIYKQIIPHGRIPMKVPTNHVHIHVNNNNFTTYSRNVSKLHYQSKFFSCFHGGTRPPFVMFVE